MGNGGPTYSYWQWQTAGRPACSFSARARCCCSLGGIALMHAPTFLVPLSSQAGCAPS